MLWYLLGAGFYGSIILDIVFLVLAIGALAYIVRIKRVYGSWIGLANCDHLVVAIGRDKQARLVCGERRHGIYLSIGDYGDVPLDGGAVYKIINVPQKNSLSIVYLPYALLLRAREMAGIRKLERGEYASRGKVIKIIDSNDNVIYQCKEEKEGACLEDVKKFVEDYAAKTGKKIEGLDKELRVVEEPIIEVEIDKPEVIRPEDIRNWQVYSFNPIILRSMNESYTISELGRYKSIIESPWIKLVPIIAIISVVALILAFIKLWW